MRRNDSSLLRSPRCVRWGARIDLWIASLYQDWGDVERGHVLLASPVSVLRAQAEDPHTQGLIAQILGRSAMHLGKHEEADRHFRAALEFDKVAWADCPCIVFRYSELARNLSMQGRFDEAEAVLASVPNIAPMRGQTTGNPLYAEAAFLARSGVKLDRGDPAAALTALPPDQAEIGCRQPATRHGTRRADPASLHAAARCQPYYKAPLLTLEKRLARR